MMKIALYCAAAGLALIAGSATAAPVLVYGNTSTPVVIGTVAAGQAYTVTTTGTVSLCGSCNNGGPLVFNANGTVASTAFGSYAPFNSGPQDHDPSVSPGSSGYYGFYGAGVFLGALYGSFTATPRSAADLFLMGSSYNIAAGGARTLYAVVNDSNYTDNPATAFVANLIPSAGPAAVPEPASWTMMIAGFGLAAAALRQRRRAVVSFG